MLEVFGAGCGRTGTLSLKSALERLGFGPCHHMLIMMEQPEQIAHWQRAARGEPMDWAEVYADYRSGVDWPGARFWREITEAFPEAKVILTLRDPESWYESAMSSIYAAASTPLSELRTDPVLRKAREMSHDVVWDGVFDGRFADKEHALKVFKEHNEAVIQGVDPERLLVYEVSQGWEPLCAFLDVPVPDEPFPHSNDRAQFAARLEERKASARP